MEIQDSTKTLRLNANLTRGLTGDDRQEFFERWKSSKLIREKVTEVLTNELNAYIIAGESSDTWASPNAMAVLSDNAGYRRAIRFAIKLLSDKESND